MEGLTTAEKKALSEKYSTTRLNNYLSGYGMPELEKCLYSNEKRVVFVLEDNIKYRSHKAINLNIPEYLYEHSKRKALTITATLVINLNLFPEIRCLIIQSILVLTLEKV